MRCAGHARRGALQEARRGLVRAVLDLRPDLWFVPCHFKGDPVMPGCLGLDALWQLLGFFLGWLGAVVPLGLTVALTALELLVAFLQAYVFAILTCIYLSEAINAGH